VPGHEDLSEYGSGAWGLICTIVIAQDDGWMLQQRIISVLQLLGVERIIVVINKCDLGDDEYRDIKEVRKALQYKF
jgi:selenocysteine-specific elongation factor